MLKQYGTLVKTASLSFLTISLGIQSVQSFEIISFDGNAARWNTNNSIAIEYDPDFGSGFNDSGCDKSGKCIPPGQAIQSSISSWKNVSGVDIKISSAVAKTIPGTPRYDGKNQIKFFGSQWQNLPFVPPPAALAVTISTYDNDGKILDADIFVNGEFFSWGVVDSESENNLHDIENVITHEMGHFFGLNHTSENMAETDMNRLNATMFFASLPGETFRRSLDTLDINGIQHLYTTDNMPEPSMDQITPNDVQINYQGNATFEIDGNDFTPLTSVVIARKSDNGDVAGRVISVEDSKMTVSFDMSTVQSGEYDIVVANSYNSFTRMEKALRVQNSSVLGTYDSNNANTNGGGGCHSSGSSSILFFLLPLLWLIPRRVKVQSNLKVM